MNDINIYTVPRLESVHFSSHTQFKDFDTPEVQDASLL